MTSDTKPTAEYLEPAREAFQEAMSILATEEDQFWNSLTNDQQLLAFCSVVRRLYQAEVVEKRSYRGVLYNAFGFGLDAYVRAQNAKFLELHNSIYDPDYDMRLVRKINEMQTSLQALKEKTGS